MKIIPAIDLIGGKTVRLIQGEYDRKLSYDIDPVEAALKWKSLGALLVHVVDLDGAKEGHPVNMEVVEKIIKEAQVPVEVGGGFRTKDDIREALQKGVSRVIIGSMALEDMRFARECIEEFGPKVILSIDVKNLKPNVRGWEEDVDMDVPTVLSWFKDFGAEEIIYTDIKSDGMLLGPALESLDKILSITDIKIISAGGVKTVEDIKALKGLEEKGLSGVIIGRALYEGTIDLKEAIDAG